MLKLYFRQALELMKQNKLFTWIYIFGTAIAIASTTIMAVLLWVKVAPLYPEYNRDRTYYLENLTFTNGNSMTSGRGLSLQAVKDWIYPLKNVEVVSAESAGSFLGYEVTSETGDDMFNFSGKAVDCAFFKIFSYKFIEGKPFSESDFESSIKSAVISDNAASQLFGSDIGVVGKKVWINNMEYTVCGVIEEPSKIMSESYAQLLIPYTCVKEKKKHRCPAVGSFTIKMLCKDAEQAEALKAEVKELERKHNASISEREFRVEFSHYPISTMEKIVNEGKTKFTLKDFIETFGLIFIVLLFVPALNLSGMITGRMERRMHELGVRKSFGATRGTLLSQMLWENFFLTIVGGAIGLVITCVVLFLCREWVFSLLDMGGSSMGDVRISAEMLFSPVVFIFSFLVCVILNFLSALIPAWRSLRRPIVDSLNLKK